MTNNERETIMCGMNCSTECFLKWLRTTELNIFSLTSFLDNQESYCCFIKSSSYHHRGNKKQIEVVGFSQHSSKNSPSTVIGSYWYRTFKEWQHSQISEGSQQRSPSYTVIQQSFSPTDGMHCKSCVKYWKCACIHTPTYKCVVVSLGE